MLGRKERARGINGGGRFERKVGHSGVRAIVRESVAGGRGGEGGRVSDANRPSREEILQADDRSAVRQNGSVLHWNATGWSQWQR